MSMQGLALSPAAKRAVSRTISHFQSDSAEILDAPTPLSARMTLHVLAAFIVAGIGLSAIVPLEQVVTARGRVTSVSPKIVVQPLETSIIRQINVREGQVVKAGDVLATLDPTFSTADVTTLTQRIASLEAETTRLSAELADKPYVQTTQDASGELQARIYDMRKAELKASIAGYDQKIASTQAQVDRARQERDLYTERLSLVREVETMRSTLEKNKTGSRLNTIIASDARVEIERNIAAQTGVLAASSRDLDVLLAQRDAFIQKRKADAAAELVTQRRLLDAAHEDMAKASRRSDLIHLRAPEDAVVLQIGDVSVGSVLESAKKAFTLVPLAGGLQVEAEVGASDQGYVKVGQPVELKLDAWPFARHGAAHGIVRSLSADSFTQRSGSGENGPTVFLAHIDIGNTDLHDAPADFRLVPGMPLTADVDVGSRTLLSYILDKASPVLREGLREP